MLASIAPTRCDRECPLTHRELEVLAGVAQGMRSRDLACQLHMTERSAINCVSRIIQKLGVTQRTAAVVLALQYGWLDLHALPVSSVLY